ncbi:hypothetical protein HYDPIDRAFT_29044 [Hydnomerulius pinastri MD-312]|uniref:Uncharacterized protein n=1 Tax=Hydnomerulius pinastri MD-312 TaxID=994086 RepID=A0A0C9VF69_9AGAM|nr:hypothetical protein HYDPIDRAFT_29044 [Hydnomerulius pinastri MD-312]
MAMVMGGDQNQNGNVLSRAMHETASISQTSSPGGSLAAIHLPNTTTPRLIVVAIAIRSTSGVCHSLELQPAQHHELGIAIAIRSTLKLIRCLLFTRIKVAAYLRLHQKDFEFLYIPRGLRVLESFTSPILLDHTIRDSPSPLASSGLTFKSNFKLNWSLIHTRFLSHTHLSMSSSAQSTGPLYYVRSGGVFFVHDACLLYHQPPTVFTMPNTYDIPQLFHWEDEDIQAPADGRFGYVDLHQWPQM